MNPITLIQLAEAINHNAELLRKHLEEGTYVHRQEEPDSLWRVEHKLGSLRPLIQTYDPQGRLIAHSVNIETQTHDYAELLFDLPLAGIALLRY